MYKCKVSLLKIKLFPEFLTLENSSISQSNTDVSLSHTGYGGQNCLIGVDKS